MTHGVVNVHFVGSSTWQERFVLALIILSASLLWGIPVTNVLPLERFLNNKIVTGILMGGFTSLVLIYGWNRSKAGLFNISSFFEKHQWWIIFLLFISYATVMSFVSVWKHQAFQTHAFDLAIFDQAIWSTLKGKLLFSSLKGNICLLGDHMSPILLLFVPLYALWSDVRVLLIAQAVLTALCLFPLGLIAQEKLGRGAMPILFAFAFFFYQPLRHSVRAEFHPELLANPLSFMAFYVLMKERWKLFFSTLMLLVLCKENMYGVAFAFGLFLLLERHVRAGWLVIILSVLLFLFTTQVGIPFFSGAKYFYQANYDYFFSGDWGTNPPLIVQPLDVLEYVTKIYLPVGFLSFCHWPTLLLTFPILFQNLLSRNPFMHSIAFQYTSGLTPFVFISAIYGWSVLVARTGGVKRNRLTILFSSAVIICSLVLTGRPERQHLFKYQLGLDQHAETTRKLLRSVPESLSVVANANLVPHLSHRFQIRQFEDYQRMPQAAVYPMEADVVILDRRWTEGSIESEIAKVVASGYRLVVEHNGLFVLSRESLDHAVLASLRDLLTSTHG